MSNQFAFMCVALLFLQMPLFSFPAMADDLPTEEATSTFKAKDLGGYVEKESTVTKDDKGTVTTEKTTKDVSFDRDGNKIETDDTKKIVDPKGIFNKESTTEVINKSAELPDGGKEISHKELVNGKTIEDNKETITPP